MSAASTEDTVIVRRQGRVGRLTLNRPRAIHALNLEMCDRLTAALLAWRREPGVELVILDHAGERGFCAGGDIRMLAESGAEGGVAARAFFMSEYRLNELLFGYPKPVCVFMDGVVMGGGAGLALPCRYRIATERTTFAMPEAAIGLFPDVGGGWHLPRLPHRAGLWLALTGERIGPADCMHLGICTDYLPGEEVESLKARIVADPARVGTTLKAAAGDPGPAPIAQRQDVIRTLFDRSSVESILVALEGSDDPWARSQAAAMRSKSPQTLKVAFRQLQMGAQMPCFAANMAMEYAIAARVVGRHDFIEGVRALLIDKDNAPRWDPDSLEAVSEILLDQIFAPLPPGEAWTPLT